MPELLSIKNGGIEKKEDGYLAGVIHFDITTNESKPERITAYCRPNHQEIIITSLRRVIGGAVK